MTHQELVERAAAYLKGTMRCGVVFTELSTQAIETPDAIGFRSGESILLECKTSRNDFFHDRKKPHRRVPQIGVGKYRFYFVPDGLVKPEEVPERWGLIYVRDHGCRRVHGPRINSDRRHEWAHEYNEFAERTMMLSALRRIEIRGLMPVIYDLTMIGQ